jgi:ubiquitin-protein ligase
MGCCFFGDEGVMMRESPRNRRLRNDRRALEKLRAESTIFDFRAVGGAWDKYVVRFYGKGLYWHSASKVLLRELHEVRIGLSASYPRMMPDLSWSSPVFHPNVSSSGVVCLGGYGTYWVPSLSLDELCVMLWDMVRYQNYDIESPYNRDAALWAKEQTEYALPVDPRPLRNLVARRVENSARRGSCEGDFRADRAPGSPSSSSDDVLVIDGESGECAGEGEEIVEAEVVEVNPVEDQRLEDQDIIFLD